MWRCDNEDCDRVQDIHRKRVKSRERWHSKPGPYGDGFFCTLNCGHDFAVAAAKNGFRLKPYKEDEDNA
jgi:hypothetical protein